jgi:hypothetical protein
MKLSTAITTACCMALMYTALVPAARADEANRKTVMTFTGPVEIPGVHLKGWSICLVRVICGSLRHPQVA